jgi:peroxisomal membrane protein 4
MNTIDKFIAAGNYKDFLSIIKGFRNGLVYGVKIRFPHALGKTCLSSHDFAFQEIRPFVDAKDCFKTDFYA